MPKLSIDWPPERFSIPTPVPNQETVVDDDDNSGLSSSLPLIHFSSRENLSSNIFASLAEVLELNDASVQESVINHTATMTSTSRPKSIIKPRQAAEGHPHGAETKAKTSTAECKPNVKSTDPGALRYASSGSTTHSKQSASTVRPSPPSSKSSLDYKHDFPNCSTGAPVMSEVSQTESGALVAAGKSNQAPRKSLPSRKSARSSLVPTEVAYKNKPLPPEPRELLSALDLSRINRRLQHSVRRSIAEPTGSAEDVDRLARGRTLVELKGPPAQLVPTSDMPRHSSSRKDVRDSQEDQDRSASSPTPLLFGYRKSSVTAEAVERVVLKVLSSLDSLEDLKSIALVNKTFYREFRRYERSLVNRILYRYSLPAWELRQVMKHEHKRSAFKLKSIQRDIATVRALQSFMLMKCQPHCRTSTLDGLLGNDTRRKVELDNAIWRIWTFCKLFGKKRVHASNLHTQTVWLDGGERHKKEGDSITLGVGNGTGLTSSELEDMSEMWRCMEALLAGFNGRETEARAAGIYDQCKIDEQSGASERVFLHAWVQDILSLGPKAVLSLTSCSFEQAKVLGVTRWSPPAPSQGQLHFLKSAVEHVYRDRLVVEATQKAFEYDRSVQTFSKQQRRAMSQDYHHHLVRTKTSPSQLRIRTGQRASDTFVTHQRSKSLEDDVVRPDCDPLSANHQTYSSNSSNASSTYPAEYSSLAVAHRASLQIGSSLFPGQRNSMMATDLHEMSVYPLEDPYSLPDEGSNLPHIVDPVDKAIEHLVRDKGYPEVDAKRALSLSDDGRGVSIERALKYLSTDETDILHSASQSTDHSKLGVDLHHLSRKIPKFHLHSDTLDSVRDSRRSLPLKISTSKKKRHHRLSVASIRKSFSLGVIPDTEEEEDEEDVGAKDNANDSSSSSAEGKTADLRSGSEAVHPEDRHTAKSKEDKKLTTAHKERKLPCISTGPPANDESKSSSQILQSVSSVSSIASALDQHYVSPSGSGPSRTGSILRKKNLSNQPSSHSHKYSNSQSSYRSNTTGSVNKFSPVSPMTPVINTSSPSSANFDIPSSAPFGRPPTSQPVQTQTQPPVQPGQGPTPGLMTFFLSSSEDADENKPRPPSSQTAEQNNNVPTVTTTINMVTGSIKRKPLRKDSSTAASTTVGGNTGGGGGGGGSGDGKDRTPTRNNSSTTRRKGVRWKDRESNNDDDDNNDNNNDDDDDDDDDIGCAF